MKSPRDLAGGHVDATGRAEEVQDALSILVQPDEKIIAFHPDIAARKVTGYSESDAKRYAEEVRDTAFKTILEKGGPADWAEAVTRCGLSRREKERAGKMVEAIIAAAANPALREDVRKASLKLTAPGFSFPATTGYEEQLKALAEKE